MNSHPLIRKIYLYTFALIGLVLVVIGAVRLVSLGLKAFIFTEADKNYIYPMAKPVPATTTDKTAPAVQEPSQEETQTFQDNQTKSQRERDAAESIALIIVGLPLYLYHWGVIKKDRNNA